MMTETNGQIGLARTALVVEGGAMRGIFTTGVLDGFLEQKFNPFDLYVGVSAGAGNLAAYLADMPGRNRTIYTDLSIRPEFISLLRFLRGGHLMDLDWMWDITIARMSLDLPAIYSRRKPFLVGLTDVATGKAFSKETSAEDLEHLLKASSALPVFYRGFPLVDGRPVADGGVSDPIPVNEAIRRGSRRIMVIRSRPRGFLRKRDASSYFMSWFLKAYPGLRETVLNQNVIYNQAVSLIQNPPPGVAIVEVSPPAGFRLERFTRDAAVLLEGYEQGRLAAEDAISRWDEPRATIRKT
jgi:predicted patatin/cPLA2 family phospholipase